MPVAERVKKKLSEQGVVHIQSADVLLDGYYVELQPSCISGLQTLHAPSYRRIQNAGSWACQFALYDASLHRWCLTKAPWQLQEPAVYSACSEPSSSPLQIWEASGWQRKETSATELTVSHCVLSDLSIDARREAKAAFKEPLKFTSFKSTVPNCPSACHNPEAKYWGLSSETALYAHLCMFHRNSAQYYEMNSKYWDESVYIELCARSESTEELLKQFEKFMRQHDYEKKTRTQTVNKHIANLRSVIEELDRPLTRQLADDPSSYEQLSQWSREITSKGHFSASLRWFKKFVEVCVVEEVLAAHMSLDLVPVDADAQFLEEEAQLSAVEAPDMALESKRAEPLKKKARKEDAEVPQMVLERVSAEPLNKETKKQDAEAPQIMLERVSAEPLNKATRKHDAEATQSILERVSVEPSNKKIRKENPLTPDKCEDEQRFVAALHSSGKVRPVKKISQAADPYEAILQLQERVSQPRSSSARLKDRRLSTSDKPEGRKFEPAPLSKLFGLVAAGDPFVAEQIAGWEEKNGPCSKILEAPTLFPTASCNDKLHHVWLWAYCGVRDRTEVLQGLLVELLKDCSSEKFGHLLKQLLSVAKSPHKPPLDVLEALDALFAADAPGERVHFKLLERFAKRSFKMPHAPLSALLDGKWPRSVKVTVLGAGLAQQICSWPNVSVALDAWWNSMLQKFKTLPLAQWYQLACFATGFCWNCFSAAEAYRRLVEMSHIEPEHPSCNANLCSEFRNLQLHASKKAGGDSSEAPAIHPSESGEFVQSSVVPAPDPSEPGEFVQLQSTSPPRGYTAEQNTTSMQSAMEQTIEIESETDGDMPVDALATSMPKELGQSSEPSVAPPVAGEISRDGTRGAQLTAEQRARIEVNRQQAILRKRLREQQSQPQDMPNQASTATSSDSGPLRPVATPMAPESVGRGRVQTEGSDDSIRELDQSGQARPIKGKVHFRSDHKNGSGFTVRLSDATGSIDFKFFRQGADHFRSHAALSAGSSVRLAGFKIRQLNERQMEFAPAGRKHELVCPDNVNGVAIELLQTAPENPARRQSGLRDALLQPAGARVNINSAFAVKVGDLETKVSQDGQVLSFREVGLGPDSGSPAIVRWILWNNLAQDYGSKQLLGQRVGIHGATVKVFKGKKELTGCWKNGGIELLAG